MKLYEQSRKVIYDTQNKDPFFWYLTRKLFSYVDVSGGGVLLDLGCGSGRNTFYAAKLGLRAIGVDYMKKAVDNGNSHAASEGVSDRVKFVQADLTKLKPKQFGLVDYVVLNEVIEHIEDFQKIIDFAYASLRPGGKILLTTPNDPAFWTILDDYAQHVRRFTLSEIEIAFAKFRDVHISTLGFPFHKMVIRFYHWISKLNRSGHDPKYFRSSHVVSRLYYIIGSIVMRIDDMFHTKGGTTILAIGTK